MLLVLLLTLLLVMLLLLFVLLLLLLFFLLLLLVLLLMLLQYTPLICFLPCADQQPLLSGWTVSHSLHCCCATASPSCPVVVAVAAVGLREFLHAFLLPPLVPSPFEFIGNSCNVEDQSREIKP